MPQFEAHEELTKLPHLPHNAALLREYHSLRKDISRLSHRIITERVEVNEAEKILGRALGYVSDCTEIGGEKDDVCIGEHTLVTIAEEAANKIKKLKAELRLYQMRYQPTENQNVKTSS